MRTSILKRLWTDLVDEALSEISDQAGVGGLGYTLACDTEGVLMQFDGYSPQLGELVAAVLQAMRNVDPPDQAVFDRLYDTYARDLANFKRTTSPLAQAGMYARNLRVGHAWLPEEKAEELKSALLRTSLLTTAAVTMDEVLDFGVEGPSSCLATLTAAVLGRMSLQAFVHSDQHKSVALGWFDQIVKELDFAPTPVEDLDKPRTGLLPAGMSFLFRRDKCVFARLTKLIRAASTPTTRTRLR